MKLRQRTKDGQKAMTIIYLIVGTCLLLLAFSIGVVK